MKKVHILSSLKVVYGINTEGHQGRQIGLSISVLSYTIKDHNIKLLASPPFCNTKHKKRQIDLDH